MLFTIVQYFDSAPKRASHRPGELDALKHGDLCLALQFHILVVQDAGLYHTFLFLQQVVSDFS